APVTEPAEGTLGTDGSAGAEVPANSEVIKEPAIPASSQVTRVDRDAPVTEPAEGTLGTDGSAGGVEEVNVSLAGTVGVDDARDPAGPKYIGDSTDVVVTEYIGGPAGFGSIHLKLEAEEIEGIGELRKLVTSPSQDYKTYNDSEFDGLISDLGVLKAKKIAIAYNAYAAERKRLQEELDAKINDVEISPKLQAELDDAKKRAEFAIRSAFTKFNGDGTALDVIPDPNRVYASMLYLNSEYFFARFKEYLANSVKYKEMEGELTESQKGTFRYINDKMTDPKFCIYFLLGILNVTQLKEIANLHSRIIEAQDAASKALAEALDVKGKKDCETRFSLELLDYHNYLNASKYKRANPKQFYDHMVKGEHVNSFIDSFRGIEYQASNLPRKRKYVITQVLP
ncbi:BTA121 domain-containing protein surface lipoprotein, partial [Borrelia coriaceae]